MSSRVSRESGTQRIRTSELWRTAHVMKLVWLPGAPCGVRGLGLGQC